MRLLSCFLLSIFSLEALPVQMLYNSLNPQSIPQHLAFYQLYSETTQGKQVLKDLEKLLTGFTPDLAETLTLLINRRPYQDLPNIPEETLNKIEQLGQFLPNRRLKGHAAQTEEEILALHPDEIDVGRALLLAGKKDKLSLSERTYEAILDLMALQLLTKTSLEASPQEKIDALNSLIFDEMGFRFPPHSIYAQEVDLFTFLPSVIDGRQGVCLGVSLLYLSLAQRLALELEVITPPGHIYIRWKNGNNLINIETTARGANISSEAYLGVDTCGLQPRTLKETIGLASINEASVLMRQEKFELALACYQKAFPYLPNDEQLQELMGFCHLFLGDKDDGEKCLKSSQKISSPWSVAPESLIADYFDNAVEIEGIRALFIPVDAHRDSILKKKKALEEILNHSPRFRQGWHALGICWMQLHRPKEALEAFSHFHVLDSNHPEVEYYLAALQAKRLKYEEAWNHLKKAEKLTQAKDHCPKALKQLRKELAMVYPE